MSVNRIRPDPKALDKIHDKWMDPAYMTDTRMKAEITMLLGVIEWQMESVERLKAINEQLQEALKASKLKLSPAELAAARQVIDKEGRF